MTSASVVDPCFAAAMVHGRVTNLAGVPHSFELLERAGPELVHVPSLRFVTQAGGRMRARAGPGLGRALPPVGRGVLRDVRPDGGHGPDGLPAAGARHRATRRRSAGRSPAATSSCGPSTARRPTSASSSTAVPTSCSGTPRTSPNWRSEPPSTSWRPVTWPATTPTADVFEIVGRRSRFVKPFGLRIDLDAVEAELAAAGFDVVATGDDDVLVVGAPGGPVEAIKQRVVALTGLPAGAVCVDTAPVPRTANGKVDYETLRARAGPARPIRERGGAVARPWPTCTPRCSGAPMSSQSSTFLSLGRRLAELRGVLRAAGGDARPAAGGLAPAHRRLARRRRPPPGAAAARHDGSAAGRRDLRRRRHPHVVVVLPGRRPPDARRRRLQLQPLPPLDRRHRRPRPSPWPARSPASPSP